MYHLLTLRFFIDSTKRSITVFLYNGKVIIEITVGSFVEILKLYLYYWVNDYDIQNILLYYVSGLIVNRELQLHYVKLHWILGINLNLEPKIYYEKIKLILKIVIISASY